MIITTTLDQERSEQIPPRYIYIYYILKRYIYILYIKALQGMVRRIIFQVTVLMLKHLLENK